MNTQPKHRELSRRMGPDKPWKEVAENFECPICGLGKDAFDEE